MTTLLIYIIRWGIALTVLYSLYGLFLRKETFHRLNRVVLVGILAVSMILPVCHLSSSNKLSRVMQQVEQSVSQEAQILERQQLFQEGATIVGQESSAAETVTEARQADMPSPWFVGLVGVYLIGLIVSWVRYFKGYVSLWSVIHYGQRVKRSDVPKHIHLTVNPKATMPCSWMRWIMLTPADLQQNGEMIIRHELAHIRKGHSWDMLLCDLTTNMLWCLPFAYMLRTDLRDVHEYQADKVVMDSTDDTEQYHRLLIAKASVVASAPIVNNLNASAVKKRLVMMFRERSGRMAHMKVLYVLPLLAVVLMGYARPHIVEEMRQVIAQEEVKAEAVIDEVVAPVLAELPGAGETVSAVEPDETDAHAVSMLSPESDAEPQTDTAVSLSTEDSLALVLQTREAERAQRAEERRKARLKGPMAEDGLPIFYDLPLNTRHDILYDGVWMERRDNECLLHIVHTFEKDDEIYYLAGEDSYIQDQDNPSVLYKCRGTSIARAFDTQFHVCGMRGKSVDLTIIFPPLPESYRYIHLIGVGFKDAGLSRGVFTRYELEPEKSTPRR